MIFTSCLTKLFDKVALPAFAAAHHAVGGKTCYGMAAANHRTAESTAVNQYLLATQPTQQTHSSNVWWPDGTDRQTPNSCIDPALCNIMQAGPKSCRHIPTVTNITLTMLFRHKCKEWQH